MRLERGFSGLRLPSGSKEIELCKKIVRVSILNRTGN